MSKYKFKAFSGLTLKNAQTKLIEHSKKVGIYENFGDEVIRYLKDKYKFDPYNWSPKQQKINSEIMNLYEWCKNYNGK